MRFQTKSPPSLAEGDLGGGYENATNAKNSQNSANLKANSSENSQKSQDKGVENSQNAEFTHPQTPSAREGALPRNLTTKFLNFTQTKSYKILCWFLTFNFINLAWIFFRAENLQGALNLLKSMFGVVWVELPAKWHRMPESLAQISGRNDTIFYIIIAVLLCVLAKNSFELVQNFRSNAFKFSLLLKFNTRAFSKKILLKGGVVFVKFLVSVGLFWVSVWLLLKSLLTSNAYSPFIYFNF